MKRRLLDFIINFIVRSILGIGLIFFVNEFLTTRGYDILVGVNWVSFLTSGILGVPGVCLLYGISAFHFL